MEDTGIELLGPAGEADLALSAGSGVPGMRPMRSRWCLGDVWAPAQPRYATSPRFRADPRGGGCLTSAGREGHRPAAALGAATHGVL